MLDAKQQRAALAMMKNREMYIAEIGRHFGVSRSTLYNLQAASTQQAWPSSGKDNWSRVL